MPINYTTLVESFMTTGFMHAIETFSTRMTTLEIDSWTVFWDEKQ